MLRPMDFSLGVDTTTKLKLKVLKRQKNWVGGLSGLRKILAEVPLALRHIYLYKISDF